jgi:hypothetical protein
LSRDVYATSPNLRNLLKQYDLFDGERGHERAVCLPEEAGLGEYPLPKIDAKTGDKK